MRHKNGLGAVFAEMLNSRETPPHAGVVGNGDLAAALFDRNIEINPNQHTLSLHLEISNTQLAHLNLLFSLLLQCAEEIKRSFPTARRSGCCNPTRCRTSR